jgi:hypothetical protein
MSRSAGLVCALRAAPLAAAAAATAIGLYLNLSFYSDDAFIALRYASNLIEGHGPVWNPGERVEGYTSFLSVVGAAALGLLGLDLVLASRLLNGAALVALAVWLWQDGTRDGVGSGQPLWPAALVGGMYPLLVWALGGLEAPLFALLSTAAIGLLSAALTLGATARGLGASGLLFALAAMTRPDGGIPFGLAVLWLVGLVGLRRVELRRAVWLPGAFAAVYGPYFLWRFHYYGAFLPNPFYVKALGFDAERLMTGARYVSAAVLAPPFVFPVLFGISILCARKRLLDASMAYLWTCILVYSMYVAAVGGDHMPAYRLVAPVLAWGVLLLSRQLRALRSPIGPALLLLMPLQVWVQELNPRVLDRAALVGRIVAEHIRTAWPPGSRVALNTAGSTPYFAPVHVYIDMLGLNDAVISRRRLDKLRLPYQSLPGHAKGDGAYVLSRRPDFIILGPAAGTSARHPWFLSDLEIARDPSFTRDYRPRQVQIAASGVPGFRDYPLTHRGTIWFRYYEKTPEP